MTIINFTRSLFVIPLLVSGFASLLSAQTLVTLETALASAEKGSPTIQRYLYTIEQNQYSLQAQKADLKSRFSLTLNPIDFSNRRTFDNQFSQWFTNENFTSTGTFQVDQPILRTDGTISLINSFGWRSNSSEIAGFGENSNEAFSNNLYLLLNQPLFTYNRRKQQLAELELTYENANLNYSIQRLQLEKTIASQFFDVYLAQLNLDISKEEMSNTNKNFETVKNKVEAGLLAEEELYQAELNFANAQLSVQDNELALANAEELFKREVGMDIDEDIQLVTDLEITPIVVDLDQAIEYALNSRMELRQRQIEIERSFFEMERTKSQNEFRADLQMTLGIFGDDPRLGRIYDNPTRNPSVALSFQLPIFDWGARKARIKAQEVAIESQRLDLDQDKIQIRMDLRREFRNLEAQLPRIDIARKSVENAERTYEINLERYINGDLTGIDLNQFQSQLSSKKIEYAQALINYKTQILNLKILTLYDWEKREPVSIALPSLNSEYNKN